MTLPASFTALYRTILRASSAAVLHSPRATKNLRKLYRPVFEDAARVYRQQPTPESTLWLKYWTEQIENTLPLLLSSATTASTAHRLTSNLAFISDALHKPPKGSQKWDPQRPEAAAKEAQSLAKAKSSRKGNLSLNSLAAMKETMRMAEGRLGVALGRWPSPK